MRTAPKRLAEVSYWTVRRMTSGLPVGDVYNRFRALNRKALETMTLTQERIAHVSEIIHEIARLNLRW